MKNILFLCNTHFQIIVAINLKFTIFKNDNVDIIITDCMNESKSLYERIKKHKLFRYTYHFNLRKYILRRKNIRYYINIINNTIFIENLAKSVNLKENYYDELFVNNVEFLAESLNYYLRKKNNNLKICLYEEGYSSYTNRYKNSIYSNKVRSNLLKKVFMGKSIKDYAEEIYLYNPDLIMWKSKLDLKKIEIIKKDKKIFLECLNDIFGYYDLKDKYDSKVIYFEESYFWDNRKINDEEIIEEISKYYGKDNIMIKLHPRNRINRFEKLGYKTNKTIGIPWEIIALNMKEDQEKIFITFTSGSVLSYKILDNKNFKSIMLYKCYDEINSNVDKNVEEYFKAFHKKYNENLYIPNNRNELKSLMRIL